MPTINGNPVSKDFSNKGFSIQSLSLNRWFQLVESAPFNSIAHDLTGGFKTLPNIHG
ncbi:hypothetical protein [Limnohabitans sp.]|uniref:hypothetical protein n=1 Tax=Limnohabitans sp. TaxID=1907725 RepID=UPI00333FE253